MEVNEALVRQFLSELLPEQIHAIAFAVTEYSQDVARRHSCADLVDSQMLTRDAAMAGTFSLLRWLHAQADEWEDPLAEELEGYIDLALLQ